MVEVKVLKFSEWLYLEAAVKDPYSAMEILGLTDLAGQILTPEVLRNAWKTLARTYHPDVYKGEDAHDKASSINGAYELLQKYINKSLPSSASTSSSYGASSPESTSKGYESPFGGYGRSNYYASKYNHYSETEVDEWITNLVNKNYFQLVIKDQLDYPTFGQDFGAYSSHMGSQVQTKKLKNPSFVELKGIINTLMQRDNADFPANIVDMKINEKWKEGWITYIFYKEGRSSPFYRSIVFKEVKVPVKKAAGVGMKKDEVQNYLRSKELVYLGSSSGQGAGDYYGYHEHRDGKTFIGTILKLQTKVVNIVNRSRVDYYGTSKVEEMKLRSFNYSDLTPTILDQIIALIQKRKP